MPILGSAADPPLEADGPPPVLIGERRIRSRVAALAAEISRDYAGREGLLLVGVLRGAFIFLADLARRVSVPHGVDFVVASHYGAGTAATGEVELAGGPSCGLAGRPVLLVEDILDTGHTLRALRRHFEQRQASVRICVLVRKPSHLEVDVRADYVGFDVPDVWVVGYGMDAAGRWRSLPYIGTVAGGKNKKYK